ncbi:MAG: right-handed parallel beta-helix repeat-containing protein [Minicystis sp.]
MTGTGFDPEDGWTELTPSADTQRIYVSSSTGDDANDGLSPEKAVKTVAAGIKLLRNNHPDWLLLKRGDVWNNQSLGRWQKSGKSLSEPMVISYYGDVSQPRPLLETGNANALTTYDSPSTIKPINYIAVVGLHFYADKHDPASPTYDSTLKGNEGIRWLTKTDGLLIEDVELEYYTGNITVQGAADKPITNVKVRRSVVANAYNLDLSGYGHSEGIYASFIDGLLIEENVFDHNGWHPTVPKGYATIFNHNMYIQADCAHVVVQGNITARASSHGMQVRPGGVVKDNLFVRDPLAMSFGLVLGEHESTPDGVTGEVSGNVVIEGNDIADTASLHRGYGISVGNIKSATVHDNLLAHNVSASTGSGAALQFSDGNFGVGLSGLVVSDNVVYDWHGGMQFDSSFKNSLDSMNHPVVYHSVTIKDNALQIPGSSGFLAIGLSNTIPSGVHFSGNDYHRGGSNTGNWFSTKSGAQSFMQWIGAVGETGASSTTIHYKAPDRTLGDYHASLGKAATLDAYLAEARKQARGHYRYAYTAKAAAEYIRDGFSIVP